jgi:hypothetical protein|tara:strand:+ start:542 stop:646 length:105 start_codon:yes stop_codon:yes gene_type:complete
VQKLGKFWVQQLLDEARIKEGWVLAHVLIALGNW